MIAVANAYPDSLVQLADGSVLSLASKPDINIDDERYEGTFTTRPLKLGSSLQLKTIHRILHLFDSEDGTIALRLYGSNDCRYGCGLSGTIPGQDKIKKTATHHEPLFMETSKSMSANSFN